MGQWVGSGHIIKYQINLDLIEIIQFCLKIYDLLDILDIFWTFYLNHLSPLWGYFLQTLVFDFGSEMYVWTGKMVPFNQRKSAIRLAKELWDMGYDYSGNQVNPLSPMRCKKQFPFV